MATLDSGLRNALDATIGKARDEAERAAARALTTLAVNQPDAFVNLSDDGRRLRNQLRAKARQLGDRERMDARQELSREWALVRECAYEHWHRMLFARFLAENGLLIYPEANVPVSLADCAQIAAELGIADPWVLVADYAARMLPGIFRADDPLLRVPLAAEGRQALERLLESIPRPVFTSEDGLGWVYQFWQSKRKAEVNASGVKISGADIAPVTQLFTEPYMVQFLLHNTLGAWWAARHPDDPLVAELTYLRRLDDGTPAAGTFDGWPQRAAEVTVMDPCCGSGHFLVAAFDLLRRMREREERLTPAEASVAVLRDNIHGLEIDARCTQIAAFALALTAWKVGGYQELPMPNVACSGISVGERVYEWTNLAGGDFVLTDNLRRLHGNFKDSSDLGSLISPTDTVATGLFASNPTYVAEQLDRVLRSTSSIDDPAAQVFGAAARGIMRAARLLIGKYHLVITNVPYLVRGKQGDVLKLFLDKYHPEAKADLATAFIDRCRSFAVDGGSYAIVTPQNWLFLASYRKLREKLLREQTWNHLSRLGSGAFETVSGEVVNVILLIMLNQRAAANHKITGVDASQQKLASEKDAFLQSGELATVLQTGQLKNPDARIVFGELTAARSLGHYAQVSEGLHTGDYPRFGRKFWELPNVMDGWVLQQGGAAIAGGYNGREHIIHWENGQGQLINYVRERLGSNTVTMWIKGSDAWGQRGVAVNAMGDLRATMYSGELFTHGIYALIPKDPEMLPALWAYCNSPEFVERVRALDRKIAVARAAIEGIPFDIVRWQEAAHSLTPLPELYSSDATQWPFHGHPAQSTDPLQVALARLLGYRWPQNEEDGLRRFADEDGIVCLPPIAGESPAADRLRAILAAAYGDDWSPATLERLLAGVGFGGKGLDAWLRDGAGFFKQHCALFHNRPFLWQIWDGRRDGFSALVNYHGLDGRKLDRLIYTYLGAWIAQQRQDAQAGITGADLRLSAAQALQRKLEAIREGEPPYDIYVRWKPLDKQPIGWEPDLNDGVRLNVRPFVTADVLRAKFTVNWTKDRGSNPDGSERLNDRHLSRAEKEAARRQGART